MRLFILIISLFLANLSWANQQTDKGVIVPKAISSFALIPYMQYHRTKSNLEDIKDFEKIKNFKKTDKQTLNFGFSKYPVWLKTRLYNPFNSAAHIVIEVDSPLIDKITLYSNSSLDKGWRLQRSGEIVPQSFRTYPFVRPVFPLRLSTNEYIDIAIEYSDQGTVPLPITIWSSGAFEKHQSRLLILYGLYYGIFIAMLVYNLVLYFNIGDKAYLYYVFYVASFALFQFTDNGLMHYYFSEFFIYYELNLIHLISTQLFIYGLLLFSRSLLQTNKYLPRLDFYLRVLGWSFVVLMCCTPFLDFALAAKLTIPIGVLVPISIALTTILSIKKGNNIAKYFLVAFSIFFIGSALWGLRNAGIVESNFLNDHSMQLGSAVEMIMLSMILAFRINRLRKQKYEQEQMASKAYLSISENSPDAILKFDIEGNLIYANKQSAFLPFIDNKYQMQQTLADFDCRLTKQLNLALIQLKAGIDVDNFIEKIKVGKQELHIEVRAVGEKDLEDNLISVLFLLRDITEDYNLKAQLHQNEKMQAVGQLAGGIAHDFNNQLTIIMGYADMLSANKNLDETIKRGINKIAMAAKHSAELTAQLLVFARKGNFKMKPVSLHKIVSQTISLLTRSLHKNIVITEQFNADSSIINADESKLQNAILNLCINARDAMPDGGELHLSTKLNGNNLELTIKDTGVGMSTEVMENIFEPFYTTKDVGKGTGMGLATVMGTVEAHKGTITVESKCGQGTKFVLSFPLETEKSIDSKPQNQLIMGQSSILVIDDEDEVNEITVKLLESLNYKVTSFVDAEEALDWYTDNHSKIDLIILDMIMPDLDGLETFKRIKLINFEAQVIICSGFSVELKAKEVLSLGAKSFIQKPFTSSSLSQAVAKILQ